MPDQVHRYPWKKSLSMKKQEIISQIDKIEKHLYLNSYSMSKQDINRDRSKVRRLKKKLIDLIPPLTPGCTVEFSDWLILINKPTPKNTILDKFKKQESRRYSEEEFEVLEEICEYNYEAYSHFLKIEPPTSIRRTEISKVRQEVKSSNIYDVMCAPEETTYRAEFKLTPFYGKEPITVYREYVKNTTLRQSDVRAFM